MSNTTVALLMVLCIDVMLFIGQAAVLEVNPAINPDQTFYHCQGTILGDFEASGCNSTTYVLNGQNTNVLLPSGTSSVSPTTGNIFSDGFTTLKNWLLGPIKYLFDILNGPVSWLSVIGAPQAITFAVGALWYGMTLFFIIAFLVGRID